MIGWAPTLDETVEIANELIASWLQVDYRKTNICGHNTPIKKKAFRAQEPSGKLMSAVFTISARGNLLKTLLLMPNKTIEKKVFEENDLYNFAYATSPKEKRKRKAQQESSNKHIPPHKLFQKLFSDMNNPFQHAPFNINEIDNIEHVSENSSIENINNRLLNLEITHSSVETDLLENNMNESEENNLLLNGLQNNINFTNTSNRQTIQPELIHPTINQTNIHEAILYPSNYLNNNSELIKYHNNNNLNAANNVLTDYYQPRDPELRDIVFVQEQRQTQVRNNKENINTNIRGRGGRGRRGRQSRGRGRGRERSTYSRYTNKGGSREGRRDRNREREQSRERSRESSRSRDGGRHKERSRHKEKSGGRDRGHRSKKRSGKDNRSRMGNTRRDSNYFDPYPNSFFQRSTPKENRLRKISERTNNNLRAYVNNDNEFDN
ncbi:RNA-binding protein [Anaeramoeba flamelloides]|uniref:RNA-binding protein n=1 Tax=Anaeramoeba flamelloides TaxID=1746091 RepID=A0AAV7YQ49_9EUKA|nr:RNA-binding protein [Anaeramoeba flamelloides]